MEGGQGGEGRVGVVAALGKAAIEGGAGGGQAPMPRQMASEGQMGALGGMG